MTKMKKILWVKFGWSDYYRGGPVDGNFGWLNDQRGEASEGRGHEAFNFMRAANGTYHCYVPPQAKHYAPSNDSKNNWTVVCLAKHPKYKGIHIVGWYENATLIGDWKTPNPVAASAGEPSWSYCIKSKLAYFVPPEHRNDPFSDPSVRQAKFSFLAGPNVKISKNKQHVLSLLERRLKVLRTIAIKNPDERNAPDPETSPDPLGGFGTPEHRKRVEIAAEDAVVDYYKAKKFKSERVAHLNCGYDYIFTKRKTVLHVEVKGTSLPVGRFFLTENENNGRRDSRWRLGLVTNVLTDHPRVSIYDGRALREAFDLVPYVYIGRQIVKPKDD